jgi:hypothetical protein
MTQNKKSSKRQKILRVPFSDEEFRKIEKISVSKGIKPIYYAKMLLMERINGLVLQN